MTQKCSAPSSVRKQPETFCLTLGMRTARSPRLLVKATARSRVISTPARLGKMPWASITSPPRTNPTRWHAPAAHSAITQPPDRRSPARPMPRATPATPTSHTGRPSTRPPAQTAAFAPASDARSRHTRWERIAPPRSPRPETRWHALGRIGIPPPAFGVSASFSSGVRVDWSSSDGFCFMAAMMACLDRVYNRYQAGAGAE